MLKHLTISNYALIKHLEMDPSPQLNVITGETGAGKSIMLGAIGLLMGNRADTRVLWDDQTKCVTEGTFDIRGYDLKDFFTSADLDYADQTIIRREISPGGKSRAFINDTPATLETLRKLGDELMDIHSQHETLLLGQQAFQLKLVDAYGNHTELQQAYAEAWQRYQQAHGEYHRLEDSAKTLREESDFVNFQLEELAQANFSAGEQEQLESEAKILEHAEEIKTKLQTAVSAASGSEYSTQQSLKEIKIQLQSIATYAAVYQKLLDRLTSVSIELDDLVQEMEQENERVTYDPERSAWVTDRLNLLNRLLTKHRLNTVDELNELQEQLRQKATLCANLDEELARAKAELTQAMEQLHNVAGRLTAARRKAAKPLCAEVVRLLTELGIPEAVLTVQHDSVTPGPTGADRIELLFSANKGIAPRPLAQVASGGEFSRVMFCMKYVMAAKTKMPTLVLDEIDTGVSGEIAIKLGKLMNKMASRHQVLAISHLPQIAARGHAHYVVYKDNRSAKTVSGIKLLSEPERVEAIARMIGGDSPSKVAVENAKEMLTL